MDDPVCNRFCFRIVQRYRRDSLPMLRPCVPRKRPGHNERAGSPRLIRYPFSVCIISQRRHDLPRGVGAAEAGDRRSADDRDRCQDTLLQIEFVCRGTGVRVGRFISARARFVWTSMWMTERRSGTRGEWRQDYMSIEMLKRDSVAAPRTKITFCRP